MFGTKHAPVTNLSPAAAPARRYRRRAFSLVELLAVVAILALLVAILIPSLGRARDAAKNSACQGNLKHLGEALWQYSNEWNNRFPAAAGFYSNSAVNTEARKWFWYEVIYSYTKQKRGSQAASNEATVWELYTCPKAKPEPAMSGPAWGPIANVSYVAHAASNQTSPYQGMLALNVGPLSGAMNAAAWDTYHRNLLNERVLAQAVPRPEKQLLLADAARGNGNPLNNNMAYRIYANQPNDQTWGTSPNYTNGRVWYNHSGTANILTVGGGVLTGVAPEQGRREHYQNP